jgi:sigma-E factor negative regulatory protein RseC
MATEEGVVIKIDSATALVKTTKSSACNACSARASCHALSSGNDMEVEAINMADARVGDRILLSFQSASLLKACFLLYIFPILIMILSAAIGFKAAPIFEFNASGFSAFCGFAGLFLAFRFVKSKGNQLAQKNEYRPHIIRVLK